jgi:hypothetical protein
MAKEVIQLDGRDFLSVDQGLTMAQSDFVLVLLDEIGVEHPGADGKIETAADLIAKRARGDKSTDLAQRLLHKILKSGRTSELLAGLLTEQGKKWTRREAIRNGEIFAEITDKNAQVTMRSVIVSFVIGFFQSGEALSTTSPKSSGPKEKDPVTTSAEAATSANSPESSAK